MCDSPPDRLDAFKSVMQGFVSALAQTRDCAEFDEIFAPRIECLGYQSAGYLRVLGGPVSQGKVSVRTSGAGKVRLENDLEEGVEESFPASDPPAASEAGI